MTFKIIRTIDKYHIIGLSVVKIFVVGINNAISMNQ